MGLAQHGVRKCCSSLRGGRDEEHARHNDGKEDKGEGLRALSRALEDMVVLVLRQCAQQCSRSQPFCATFMPAVERPKIGLPPNASLGTDDHG